jgi:hypothetical protein
MVFSAAKKVLFLKRSSKKVLKKVLPKKVLPKKVLSKKVLF